MTAQGYCTFCGDVTDHHDGRIWICLSHLKVTAPKAAPALRARMLERMMAEQMLIPERMETSSVAVPRTKGGSRRQRRAAAAKARRSAKREKQGGAS